MLEPGYGRKGGRNLVAKKKQLAHRPILVAVDFSPHSEAALVWAARAARCFGAPLHVLHVVHDPGSAPGYYSRPKRKKHLRRLEESAEELMAEFIDEMRKRYSEIQDLDTLKTTLVIGLPVTRILEVADKLGAGLIVLGSQGRTGLPYLLLGSKAERVAQLASVPVTIVKAPDGGSEKG
jgi:nucleotide-binding universal stress UspA family protein